MTSANVAPRLLFVLNSLRVGGSQKVVYELASTARDEGWDVIVAGKGGPWSRTSRRSVADAYGCGCGRVLPFPRQVAWPTNALKAGVSLAAVQRLATPELPGPAVVHASHPWPTSLAALACRSTGRPLLWHVHGTSAVETPPQMPSVVAAQLAAAVTITPEVGDEIRPLVGNERLHVLPNPVRAGDLCTNPPDDGVLRISTCSTLTPNKQAGVASLIEAAALIALDRPVVLSIVGDGPARTDLEATAERVRMATGLKTLFLGEHPQPWRALSECSVAVGVGLVAVEALLNGHRVVVGGSDALGGVLRADNANLLYRTNYTGRGLGMSSAEAWRDALIAADGLSDRDLQAVRDVILARHGPDASRRFLSLWQELMGLGQRQN